MASDGHLMIVSKDQSFSWAMISARPVEQAKGRDTDRRYLFFQARYAIYYSLKLLQIKPGDHVLVPSYICRAAIDPLLAYGTDVGFYAVDDQCSVDVGDIESRITKRTKALMIVHYFGFPQPLREIRHLCDIHGIALIEDCAHVLCGETDGKSMGTVGDASVFSWRKFFPIYDGGELAVNGAREPADIQWTRESALLTFKVAVNTLDASLSRARQPLLKLAYHAIRGGEALFRKCASPQLHKMPMMQAESNGLSFDQESVNWPMTRLSKWTKDHSDVKLIIAKRRRNYRVLLQELSGTSGVRPLFEDFPPTVCPWVFPIVFPKLSNAHVALRNLGIPAVTWGGVRHPQVPLNQFPHSTFLYDNLVFLPVHQCLDDEDIISMSTAVKRLCAN